MTDENLVVEDVVVQAKVKAQEEYEERLVNELDEYRNRARDIFIRFWTSESIEINPVKIGIRVEKQVVCYEYEKRLYKVNTSNRVVSQLRTCPICGEIWFYELYGLNCISRMDDELEHPICSKKETESQRFVKNVHEIVDSLLEMVGNQV